LQDRVAVPERRIELELIGERRPAFRHIVACRETNFVEDIVVEVVLVRTDAGLLVRIDGEGRCEIFAAEAL
jgi:hypothetical protein